MAEYVTVAWDRRAEALPLAVEIYKNFGALVRKKYEGLRSVQLKDFEAMVADLREFTLAQSRLWQWVTLVRTDVEVRNCPREHARILKKHIRRHYILVAQKIWAAEL